jgi:hypothetical protein
MRLPVTSLLCCLCLITLAQAGVNSGGGLGRVGALYSFGSIGSPFATGLRAVNGGSARTGLVPVLTPWHITPGVQDTDGDGMSDAWEIAHGLNPLIANANLDSDFDGVPDYQEFVTGTHPLQSGSRITASAVMETGNVRLQCPTLPGRKYRIERSTNLSGWTLQEEVIGDGNTLSRLITVPEGQTLGFYQIIVTMHRP